MSAATRRVLVLGGTGFVGRSLCERLVRAGWTPRVPTRRLGHGRTLTCLPTVELLQADVHDAAALARLLPGCDAVIHLVAILHGSAADFERVHVALPRTLAGAMQNAGVRRLVHVSALGVGPDAPSNYLRSKTAGEAVLQDAGLDLTVWRPSVIFGADDRFMNTFARLQALAPVVPLAGAGARFQPVWVEDVAAAVWQSLERPETIGRVYEAAGPEVFTLAELVRLAGRWAGHERRVIPLPDAAGRLQAALMSLAPGEPLMSADNLDSMKVPNVASGMLPGLEALGITPAALGAVAPRYLGGGPGRHRFNDYRAHARRG
jgi:NADH dehydrogenase